MAFLTLVSGIGLLLFAIFNLRKTLTDSSVNIGGIIKKTTNGTIHSVIGGFGATVCTQSSSATSSILVGLTDSGIIPLVAVLPLVVGINLGSSITVLIVSLPISEVVAALSIPFFFISTMAKRRKIADAFSILLSLSMVFIAIRYIALSAQPFETKVVSFLSGDEKPFLLFIIGALAAAITQSSTMVIAVTISLIASGEIPSSSLLGVYYLVLGTNIGTCSTALFASAAGGKSGKLVATTHLWFNVVGAVIYLFLFQFKAFRNLNDIVLDSFKATSIKVATFNFSYNLITGVAILLGRYALNCAKARCRKSIRDQKQGTPQNTKYKT